jgi:hypothetical protein
MSELLQEQDQDWVTTLTWVKVALESVGLRARLTFDLPSACASLSSGICMHHGAHPCQCRLVVIQVWNQSQQTAAVVIHGDNKKSDIWLNDLNIDNHSLSLAQQIQKVLVDRNL